MTELEPDTLADHEDPQAGPTWTIAIVGTLLLVVIIMGVTALFYTVQDEQQEREYVAPEYGEIAAIQSEQAADLQGPPRVVERVDETDTSESPRTYDSIVIPIDRAMTLTAGEYGASRR